MKGLFATCAAVALTAVFALPAPAVAAEKRADGVRNVEQMDVSSQRRYRRYGYRLHTARVMVITGRIARTTAHRTTPMHPRYYQPYYGPRVGVGVGPLVSASVSSACCEVASE